MDLQKGLQPASHVALALPRTAIRIHIASDKLPTSVPPPPCRPPIWSLGALGSGDPIPSSCGRICCEIYVNPMMIIHENGLSDVKDVQSALGHNSEPKAWVTFPGAPERFSTHLNESTMDMSQKEGQHPNISFLRKNRSIWGSWVIFCQFVETFGSKNWGHQFGQLRILLFSRRCRTSKKCLRKW